MEKKTYRKPKIETTLLQPQPYNTGLLIESGVEGEFHGIIDHRRGTWGDLWYVTPENLEE